MPSAIEKLSDAEARACASKFNALLIAYELHPKERMLGQALLGRSFLAGSSAAKLDMRDLADEIETREDRCWALLQSIRDLGLIFWNSAEAIATPNLNPEMLSRARALRVRPVGPSEKELPLDGERLLDAALASNSRSAAVQEVTAAACSGSDSGRTSFDVHQHCEEFRKALRSGDLDGWESTRPPPPREIPAAAADGAKLSYSLASASCTKAKAKLVGPASTAAIADQVWRKIEPFVGAGNCDEHQLGTWKRLVILAPREVARAFQRATERADRHKKAAYAARIMREDHPTAWEQAGGQIRERNKL